jgi:signal transduction histidine kinase
MNDMKILVIDDEERLREMMNLALREKGFEVIEAENGEQGIEVARQEIPDLILCDVNMDKVDGYLTLSSLRNNPSTAAIPFILMTGLADNAGMRHGMELGADDYLPKPFSIANLYAAVNARLQKAKLVKEEAEKAMRDLRSNISMMLPHELRTPLNGVIACGEFLAGHADTLTPTEVADMGKDIFDSGRRLEHLVENFLVYAQIELLAADSARVKALRQDRTKSAQSLVQEHAMRQAQMARRPQDLVLDLSSPILPISDSYLAKIVDELAQNAFKFSAPGTPVKVTLNTGATGPVLTITDQGCGFETEYISKVGAYMQFDRKIQEQQGQGLGLVIAKRLTEVHGGVLALQSVRGTRTVVTVKFPTVE